MHGPALHPRPHRHTNWYWCMAHMHGRLWPVLCATCSFPKISDVHTSFKDDCLQKSFCRTGEDLKRRGMSVRCLKMKGLANNDY